MNAEVFIQYLISMRNLDYIHNLEVLGAFLFQIWVNPTVAKRAFSSCYNMWHVISHNDWSNKLE
jgi:hypothetical protein